MSAGNVTDTSHNGHTKTGHDRTPEEIQLEIARTKSAITDDLRVLSERFSPQQLREGAREVMRDARVEASHLIKEAKEATIDSLIGVKDRTVESVKDSVHEAVESVKDSVQEKVNLLGTQARVLGNNAKHAGELTVNFISSNALAVSLVGFGAGWLLVALRSYRNSKREAGRYAYALPAATGRTPSYGPDTIRTQANAATHAVDDAREEARSAVHTTAAQPWTRVDQLAEATLPRRATTSNSNAVAVVALTVAAGLGLSLLFPIGRRPRRALLGAGERVWEGAQNSVRQLAEQARSLA